MLAVAACALLLTGCAQPGPVVTPHATSTVKPLFASDADALAAATKAYAAYLKMSDLISQEGGIQPERLKPLVTTKMLAQETASASELASSGQHQNGQTAFDHTTLQSLVQHGSDASVAMYVCLDLSGVQILDDAGGNVTAPGTQTRYSFVASFVAQPDSSLLLDSNAPWDGASFC
jgi:hypothetical protein